MKQVSLQLVRLSHHSVSCCALSTLAGRVHTCWLRSVCNPEVVCYTVMQRHEAQSCKQLRHTTPRKTTHTRRSSCTSAETCSSQTDQQRECACVLIRRHVRLTRSLSPQRPCARQCSATAPTRTASVWASVRTSARCLATRPNTGQFRSSPGEQGENSNRSEQSGCGGAEQN